jgi:hypothetical protein
MINLRNVYGNKIFDRKASYRNAPYIPFLGSLLLDIILSWVVIRTFQVDWEYAFIKVYAILLLFGVLKYSFTSMVDSLNYQFTVKDAMAAEMKHYLSVFNQNVDWHEVGTYDDFLLEAAFNQALPTDLRVLAGINYGTVLDTMAVSPRFENRSYRLFSQIAPDYVRNDEE